jgi:hypothetical protein
MVVDLCCGIGGDLLAFAERGPAIGVERDATIALLAKANCTSLGQAHAEVRCVDATTISFDKTMLVHIDPDRRPSGRRTTRVDQHEPSDEFLTSLFDHCAGGAIKLAPGCEVPALWQANYAFEWISEQGECKQLVAWFGSLARRPGERAATMLHKSGSPATIAAGEEIAPSRIADSIGRFVFEPDAAVIAARLVDALAAKHRLSRIAPQIAYLTGDVRIDDPLLAKFEVIDVLPFDQKRLKAALRAGGFGRLEVKKRGVDASPEELRRKLKVDGKNEATLLITPHAGKTIAVIARRVLQGAPSRE